ncbi:MAG: hypothetical protein HN542_10710 [Flavobacteriales bacterium]|nr:hypothetical protein [Flavobacteriales bacterium]NCG29239.1 hypothetical protein [Bacteroidota bacterium]MBT3962554.1 hypothetical protein [Flavobacteriales bacterium]MBT4703992.1 hypothetical protein [Flavobacteriales bacterium]MBT4930312.1 hypothetical protein [Flavobacteriales bacterium]
MRRLLVIVCFLPISIWAQNQSVTAVLDQDQILIGEQVSLTITVKTHAADTVEWTMLEDTLRAEIEIVSQGKIDTAFTGADLSQKALTQSLTITSFDSGYFVIRPIEVNVNGNTIESNPLLLSVQTYEIDTAKGIADIKPIAESPFPWKEWFGENWQWFAGGVLFLAILTWLMLYLSKEKPQLVPRRIEPTIPAHEHANQRLVELHSAELWQKGEIKKYYSELTDILREYVELQFHIPALEQTSDEIIQSMRRYPDFSAEQIDQLKRLLFLADLVKFAKENPVGPENETHFTSVESFVVETTPIVEPDKEEDSNG